MPTLTLTFPQKIQTSTQVGDMILYCNPSTTAGFSTAAQSDVVFLGACLTIAADRLSMTVDYDAGTVIPTSSSFILFSKDNKVNGTSLLGYYGECKFRNNSVDYGEMFETTAGYFESSK